MSANPRPAPRIATIIVNYKAADLIIANLSAMLAEQDAFPGSTITIVDNASPGPDAGKLAAFIEAENLGGKVRLMAEEENWGFAKGNNIALRELLGAETPPDYVFLLNPDAFPRPGMLNRLVEFMAAHPKAGIAGAKLEGEDGAPQVSAFRYFTALGEFANTSQTGLFYKLFRKQIIAPPQRDETYETEWVCGAAALIRREVFADIGLFDEAYFLYYEETDFMLRAKRAGWETWYVHDARAVHLVGQSSGVTDGKTKDQVSPPYWFRSRGHYFRANHGPVYAFFADLGWLSGSLFHAGKRAVTGKDASSILANIRQFLKIKGEGSEAK